MLPLIYLPEYQKLFRLMNKYIYNLKLINKIIIYIVIW